MTQQFCRIWPGDFASLMSWEAVEGFAISVDWIAEEGEW